MKTPPDQAFAQLVQQFEPGARLRRAWPLTGGVSALVTALEIERPDGQIRRMVVRQHGAADLQHNPQIAADEARLLQIVRVAGVAAPEPYHVDQSGAIFATPVIVVEYIEGSADEAPADLADRMAQIAAQLARIHAIDPATHDLTFLPDQTGRFTMALAEPLDVGQSPEELRIRAALAPRWPPPQRNQAALLHGDYWPGNLLWRGGLIAAVIDWEDAALGDPLADLGNARLEITWANGDEAAELLTQRYQALAQVELAALPLWDLCAALRPAAKMAGWGLDAETERSMRAGLAQFIERAIAQLPG
jgi:aminoglycoside phosphotransferase (APT) family kinase protein